MKWLLLLLMIPGLNAHAKFGDPYDCRMINKSIDANRYTLTLIQFSHSNGPTALGQAVLSEDGTVIGRFNMYIGLTKEGYLWESDGGTLMLVLDAPLNTQGGSISGAFEQPYRIDTETTLIGGILCYRR